MSLMQITAYLVNRYPEATLTSIRREILAVTKAGARIVRFSHRPSEQPLASDTDQLEKEATIYLVDGQTMRLLASALKVSITRPLSFAKAVGVIWRLRLPIFRGIGYLAVACELHARLVSVRARYLHVHFAQSSAAVAMLCRILGGPPWTMTVHGPEDLDESNLRRLKELAKSATTVIAISQQAADEIRRTAVPDEIDVRVIRMGVDSHYLKPPVALDAAGPIVCIARLHPSKGHKTLFEAIDILRIRGYRPRVELLGDGPCRDELTTEVHRRELTEQVHFTGWRTEDAVRACLDRARFLVLPSYSEGLPVVIMEAFARARPVIASDIAGVSELVQDGINGLLFPAGDSLLLAGTIQALLDSPAEKLASMGQRGRFQVEKKHDSEMNGRALADIWK